MNWKVTPLFLLGFVLTLLKLGGAIDLGWFWVLLPFLFPPLLLLTLCGLVLGLSFVLAAMETKF